MISFLVSDSMCMVEYYSILVNIFLVKQWTFCCYNLLSCFDIILYYVMIFLTREMTFLAFFLFADSGNTSHLTQYAHHDFTYYENYQPTSSNAGIYYLCNILSNNLFFKSSIYYKSPIRTFVLLLYYNILQSFLPSD